MGVKVNRSEFPRSIAAFALLGVLGACDGRADFAGRYELVRLRDRAMPVELFSGGAEHVHVPHPCAATTAEIFLDEVTIELHGGGTADMSAVQRYEFDCLASWEVAPADTFRATGSWSERGDEADIVIPQEPLRISPTDWVAADAVWTASLPEDHVLQVRVDDGTGSTLLRFVRQ